MTKIVVFNGQEYSRKSEIAAIPVEPTAPVISIEKKRREKDIERFYEEVHKMTKHLK